MRYTRFHLKNQPLKKLLLAMSFATLAACGGGDSSTSADENQNNGNTGNKFTKQAKWQVTMPAIGTASKHCYDFDAATKVNCASSTWDVKLVNSGRGVSLWTNSGTSGAGKGGALVSTWATLKTWQNATTEPKSNTDMSRHYRKDSASSVFSEKNTWYAYNLQNKHKLAPNFRTYLITTDSGSADTTSTTAKPVYAMQVINYYSTAGKSGHVTLRWINTATPNDVRTLTVDASSYDKWQYVNLASSGSLTTASGNWQVALQRYKIKLNGGDSKATNGTGKVAGFLANTPAGFYDAKGKPVKTKFAQDHTAATKANLTNVAGYAKPSKASDWVTDKKSSSLNIAYKGNYPNPLDYGWYLFTPGKYTFSAKSEAKATGALVRSNTGNSYARMRLSDISYADASNYKSNTTWTFDFDIQPK